MAGHQQPQMKRLRMGDDPSKVHFACGHSDQVFRGLNEQRQKDLFCDVVLIANGVRFPAHRSILAASSDYFNSMFTLGMQECYQKEVKLIGVSSHGCRVVLDFLYGCVVSLTSDIIDCVLKTAHLLQIRNLLDLCCKYLEIKLNVENYLQLQSLASTYSLERLDSAIDGFILKDFAKLSLNGNFIKRVPVEKLCLYLDSDRLQISECGLLRFALKWLKYCPERAKEADRVLQNIRFSLIPESDLITMAKPGLDSLSIPQGVNCHRFIDEAIHYHSNVAAQPVLQNRRSTLRADGDRLLFLGGGSECLDEVEGNVVCFLDPCSEKWITETKLPAWRKKFCVAVLGNYIFFAGGYKIDEEEWITFNMVYRYDPRFGQWIEVAPMNSCRQSFSLAAVENKLVAVGGECWDQDIGGSVEMYNPETDSWCFVATLPRPTCCHAGTTYKQHIYISGGMSENGGGAMDDLLCYDPCTDTWEEKAHMIKPRHHHGMCTLDDRIYAISGIEGIDIYAARGVECYSPACDQWTRVDSLVEPTYQPGVAAWGGAIYVLGGMHEKKGQPIDSVQRYLPDENSWGTLRALPRCLMWVGACVCVVKRNSVDKTKQRPWLVSIEQGKSTSC